MGLGCYNEALLHAMRAITSTLHLKVKYPIREGVVKLVGSQAVARQCLVATIRQQSLDKTLVGGRKPYSS